MGSRGQDVIVSLVKQSFYQINIAAQTSVFTVTGEINKKEEDYELQDICNGI